MSLQVLVNSPRVWAGSFIGCLRTTAASSRACVRVEEVIQCVCVLIVGERWSALRTPLCVNPEQKRAVKPDILVRRRGGSLSLGLRYLKSARVCFLWRVILSPSLSPPNRQLG